MPEPIRDPSQRPPLRVLIFSASLRAGSLNTRLARIAAAFAAKHGAAVDYATMREFDVPSFDGDVEAKGVIPPGAVELDRRLKASDAFVIASPEYNASVPGVLKNLIDWTSRLKPQPFHEKHALLLSASPSMVGGNRGLWALRIPLEHLGARVYPDMFSLAMANQALAGDAIADATLTNRFERMLEAFLALAEAAKNYPCIKQAWVEFIGESAQPRGDRLERT